MRFIFVLLLFGQSSITLGQALPSYLPTNGLVAWYPFNGNANDESGNGSNGIVYLAGLTQDRFGNPAAAYSFGSGPDKITVPNNSLNQLRNSFSISVWIKTLPNTFGTGIEYHAIIEKWGNSGNASYLFGLQPNGAPFFSTHDNVSTGIVSDSILKFDTWYNLIFTFNAGVGSLYINGALNKTNNQMLNPMITNNELLFGSNETPIGYYPSSLAFEGTIDDIAIYNRALSQQEIAQLYNSSPCVLVYNLFSQDTISACGSSYTLLADSGYGSYIWNTGATTQSINVTSTGWYKCTVAQGSCSGTDSVFVSLVNRNIVNNDTTICAGSSLSISVTQNQTISGNGWVNIASQVDFYTRVVETNAGFFLCAAQNNKLYKSPDLSGFSIFPSILPSHNLSFGKSKNGDLYYGTGHEGIYKSTDNGSTWNYNVASGYGCGNLDFDFDSTGTLFTGVGGYLRGLYVSSNNGVSWANTFSGYDFTNIECARSLNKTFIITNNYVGYSANGGQSWTRITGQPFSANTILVKSTGNDLYLFTKDGKIYKSNDGSNSWSFYSSFPVTTTPNIYANEAIIYPDGNWWISIDLNGVFHSSDNGMTWTNISQGLSGNPHYLFNFSNYLIETTSQGIFKRNLFDFTDTYLWSTGATTPSINVSPTQTTTYYVSVSNGISSCIDSVTITVNNPSANLFTQDTIRACSAGYTLDAGSGYEKYSWNTGATTQLINVTSTGWYKCTVTQGRCTGTDSVFVSLFNARIINNDTSICNSFSLTLSALPMSSTNGFGLIASGDCYNILKMDNSNYFISTRTTVLKSNQIDGVWTAANWPLGIVRSSTSIVGAMEKQGNRFFVASLDNGNFFSNNFGQSFQGTGVTGFGCASSAIKTLPTGDCLMTMSGFQRGIYKIAPNSNSWVKKLSSSHDFYDFTIDNTGRIYTAADILTLPGGLYRSADNGETWSNIWPSSINESPYVVEYFTDTIYLCTRNGKVFKSPTGVLSFELVSNNFGSVGLPSSFFIDSNGTFYLAFVNGLFVSRNRGGLWTRYAADGASGYYGINKIDSRIFIGTNAGMMEFLPGVSYLWSTGATTPSINVSPAQTTTYYVAVSNGISSCTDSVTISVVPRPEAGVISGADTVCAGSISNYTSNGEQGGVWQSSNTSVASIDTSNGILSSLASGNSQLRYIKSSPSCGSDTALKNIVVKTCLTLVNLKAYIQGFYASPGFMRPSLLYSGIEGAGLNQTDSIIVEIHDGQTGLLIGSPAKTVIQYDGSASVSFPQITGSHYIVIKHRNALETWSASPVIMGTVVNYDFTDAANKAFGNNLVGMSGGKFAIWSGDINQDGAIESSDYFLIENDILAILFGYHAADLSGDGIVESDDYSLMENNVLKIIFSQKPF